jgi:crotonobetainyl-CoA:carnitine CoA-transferase CaiB-like acyl-CoA transferase
MVQADTRGGLLDGLRVVEAGGEVATRYAGRLLAALGADVVQVGDRTGDPTSRPGAASRAFNLWLDEGKTRAASLDAALAGLDGAAGKSLVIAGQTPAAVEAVDKAIAGRSNLVRLGLTWFGAVGPYAGWRGNDGLIQAMSGLAFTFGEPEGSPTLPQGHSPQTVGGLTGFIAALAALMAGPDGPTRVDVNVLEAAMCLTEIAVVASASAPDIRFVRQGVNRYSPVYPSTVLKTRDGHVGVTALTWAQWTGLCEIVGQPDLAEIPYYATSAERVLFADVIDEVLIPIFLEQTTAHWVEAGDRRHVPITPALRPGELPSAPHWRDRGSFAAIDGTGVQGPTLPFRFSHDGVTRPRPNGGAQGPLTGIKVADFTMGWAGPLSTRYLADLGAEVLKFESLAKPDWWRGIDPMPDSDPPLYELPLNFMAVNRNKLGLDVDLTTAEGRQVAKAVVRQADVVVDNQGPGVMEKLGLGVADQRRLNPGVISITMPPFGRGGPLSGLRAYGTTVEHASGMPFVNGYEHWTPCKQHYGYGDPIAGLYSAAAALTALYGRDRLGGTEVELCQVECVLQLNADAIVADQIEPVRRTGNRRPGEAPSCVVRGAGEDAWLAVVCDSDAGWRALTEILGDEGLSPDWDLGQRQANADAIEAAIARWSAAQHPLAAAGALQAAGVSAGPVWAGHDLWSDQHLLAAGYWAVLNRRYIGDHLVPHSPILFDGRRPRMDHPAPWVGEHTEVALKPYLAAVSAAAS